MFHIPLSVVHVGNIVAIPIPSAARTAVGRRPLLAAALSPLLCSGEVGAQGAEWPSRPVRIVLAYPPGGSTDVLARALAERLAAAFPGPGFVVENRPGGAAVVGTQAASAAEPDGYTYIGGAHA